MSGLRVVRTGLKRLARMSSFAAIVDFLDRSLHRRAGTFAVLTYHRVAEPGERPDLYPGLVSASPTEFASQVSFLASNYPLIGIADLLAARHRGRSLPDGAVVLTFDDAYRDFTTAEGVLRHYDAPVALFVPTAFPGDPHAAFWWDRLYQALAQSPRSEIETPIGLLRCSNARSRTRSFRRVREVVHRLPHDRAMDLVDDIVSSLAAPAVAPSVLDWSALRTLATADVAIAPHTRSHPLLSALPPDRVRSEISGSLRDLADEGLDARPVLAYPGGALTAQVARIAASSGIAIGLTTQRGVNRVDHLDWMRLRRINVARKTAPALLRLQFLTTASGPASDVATRSRALAENRRSV